jgi:membrane-associated protein
VNAPAYAGLAALVGAESAGLPVPGETSLLAAAVLASQGKLALPLVIAFGAGAAVAGDNIGYAIGRWGGRRLLTRAGRWERRRRRLLAGGEAFFARHGGKAVFLARFAPGLRVTGAWLAGAGRMRWARFLVWNALGGVAWATVVGLAGYFLGKTATAALGTAGLVLLATVVGAAIVAVVIRRRRREEARIVDEPGRPADGRSETRVVPYRQ